MTYTKSTWTTTSVARVKADYVVVYRKPNGNQNALDANLVLTQMNDVSGQRRTIVGVVNTATCEVVAAPDLDGFEGLMSIHLWHSRTATIELNHVTNA